MTRIHAAAGAALLAALAACAPGEETAEVAVASEDACGAAERQALVGTSIGALDSATLPEARRIIFPGQAVTKDFRAERLNVEVGADDMIARVYCG